MIRGIRVLHNYPWPEAVGKADRATPRDPAEIMI
jgi:hypothetical protein